MSCLRQCSWVSGFWCRIAWFDQVLSLQRQLSDPQRSESWRELAKLASGDTWLLQRTSLRHVCDTTSSTVSESLCSGCQ